MSGVSKFFFNLLRVSQIGKLWLVSQIFLNLCRVSQISIVGVPEVLKEGDGGRDPEERVVVEVESGQMLELPESGGQVLDGSYIDIYICRYIH